MAFISINLIDHTLDRNEPEVIGSSPPEQWPRFHKFLDMITRLAHIQLAMPPGGEDEARNFFINVLHMREEPKPPALAARGRCWFRAGAVILYLGVEENFAPQRKAHPAFGIVDIQQFAHTLQQHGRPVLWDDTLPGRRRFYTPDPFGNRLEFIQAGDGFADR